MDLITIQDAARILQVHPNTLRRNESSDGKWCHVYGIRLRVYKVSSEPNSHRRYDREEIVRKFYQLRRGG